eukprot:TRINITY_DN61763_c0_g1_i1.p1 TRINITY_DN61763_c0_g1~~TRINITY_DN61763_c0_g1_i1.p1  ORF type:complete len:587 (+),score=107.31 TRINITY_DN61763_c0_g1_i1:215-1975(+)
MPSLSDTCDQAEVKPTSSSISGVLVPGIACPSRDASEDEDEEEASLLRQCEELEMRLQMNPLRRKNTALKTTLASLEKSFAVLRANMRAHCSRHFKELADKAEQLGEYSRIAGYSENRANYLEEALQLHEDHNNAVHGYWQAQLEKRTDTVRFLTLKLAEHSLSANDYHSMQPSQTTPQNCDGSTWPQNSSKPGAILPSPSMCLNFAESSKTLSRCGSSSSSVAQASAMSPSQSVVATTIPFDGQHHFRLPSSDPGMTSTASTSSALERSTLDEVVLPNVWTPAWTRRKGRDSAASPASLATASTSGSTSASSSGVRNHASSLPVPRLASSSAASVSTPVTATPETSPSHSASSSPRSSPGCAAGRRRVRNSRVNHGYMVSPTMSVKTVQTSEIFEKPTSQSLDSQKQEEQSPDPPAKETTPGSILVGDLRSLRRKHNDLCKDIGVNEEESSILQRRLASLELICRGFKDSIRYWDDGASEINAYEFDKALLQEENDMLREKLEEDASQPACMRCEPCPAWAKGCPCRTKLVVEDSRLESMSAQIEEANKAFEKTWDELAGYMERTDALWKRQQEPIPRTEYEDAE